MTSEYTSLERALEVSYTMLAEAREGRWDRLPRLEVERQPLLRAEYPRDARSRDLLQQLLACNEEMLALAGRARAQVANALRQQHRAGQALRTYVGVAG